MTLEISLATSTDCIVLKSPVPSSAGTCLFVTHAADCCLKKHLLLHVDALIRAGLHVVLIVNTDTLSLAGQVARFDGLHGLIVRRNTGFDFGAWADAFRLYPSLWTSSRVLLINDSIIGPGKGGEALFRKMQDLNSDLVGLVESYEHVRHFQSFFLQMNGPALQADAVRGFWSSVDNLGTKSDVIAQYELKFTGLCVQARLRTKAVYQQTVGTVSIKNTNPMIVHWRELISRGIPYAKVELIRDFLSAGDIGELKQLLSEPELGPIIDDIHAAQANAPRHLSHQV